MNIDKSTGHIIRNYHHQQQYEVTFTPRELLPLKALYLKFLGGAIDSLLFKLPREMRDVVYGYILAYPEGLHLDELLSQLRVQGSRLLGLAINFVCRVMRDETLHLALKVNKLSFGSDLIADSGRSASATPVPPV